ncbi:putative amino-acid N-acetyltransferase subunit Mak10 [Talaromyces proteolyticus]|uniref:Amino-acid N-acetyltransferase subunit Mak10 n=1 Tax=Talaromyces proteolyticus TaxID=1131652 RepID=A0AAD4Q5C0_9EURO|nr:putative amino-acid N-acetyltransferase subunit Mak10 [Talaromyces proteolyticus]KAH8704029.1 putative amino-acid N-acetyltransferase subunit Mak10 [Talaromyces proteolyticus]
MLPNNQLRVPPPQSASQRMVTRDITDSFVNAASKLRQGELVKDELFTLFEAVGALEIMDSKMDSGYLGPGENHAQALEYDYDVMRELQPEEVVGLMDQLLCHEMAWHMGHPLSQTLFTSIYLDKLLAPAPKSFDEYSFHRGDAKRQLEVEQQSPLIHIVLRAYCLGLVKACDLVHQRVTQEYYYEEEDFFPQLYNRSILTEHEVDPVQRLLQRAIQYLEENNEGIEQNTKSALVNRLRFRYHFLEALDEERDIINTRDKGPFTACLSLVGSIESSATIGKPIEEAFTLKIQRKLASTVPPRPMVTIGVDATIEYLKHFCQNAIDMFELLDYSGSDDLRVALWTMASRKPQPGVYIRSLLQKFIVNNLKVLGSTSVKRLLYDDLADLVLPSSILLQAENEEVEVPSDPRFQIHKSMEDFLIRIAESFMNTFRSSCLNRPRVRRALCHSIIEWDSIQIEAEKLDEHLQALTNEAPLTFDNGESAYSYPLDGLRIIDLRPEELGGMYWYLAEICFQHRRHLDRIRAFVIAEMGRNDSAGGNKPFERTITVLGRHTLWLVATESFALALHAMYVFLDRQRVLPHAASKKSYSSSRLRYELRMKPLLSVSLPELLPFDKFEKMVSPEEETDGQTLERANRAIGEARKAWEKVLTDGPFLGSRHAGKTVERPAIEAEWQRNTKDSFRSCIGASVAIQKATSIFMAKKSARSNSTSTSTREAGDASLLPIKVEIPEIDTPHRWHDWWAVPRISEVKSG